MHGRGQCNDAGGIRAGERGVMRALRRFFGGPYIHRCEDGSTLIEWAKKSWRFYVSFEPKLAESSWGFLRMERGGYKCLILGGYLIPWKRD